MTDIVHTQALDKEGFRPQPDGSIDPAGEAGWFLQRERERRNLCLEDVAVATGIHESHLDAIEHGDLTRLPSRMEALKMVGIYGQYLGFDPEPLIVHYAEFLPRPIAHAKAAASRMPRPLSSATVISFTHALRRGPLQRMNRTAGCCLAAAMIAGALTWLVMPGSPGEDVSAIIDPLPTASVVPEADSDAAARPAAEVSITETAMSDDRPPTPDATEGLSSEQGSLAALIVRTLGEEDQPPLPEPEADEAVPILPELPPEEAEAEPDGEPRGRIIGEENAAARIVLEARGPVLLRIEDSRGNVVGSHTMSSGDRYQVPSREDLVVVAGDGGLVGVVIDGVQRGTLGTPGELVVGRPLTVSTLLDRRG
jgi:cytoskeletal protein RodZ